MQRRKRMAPINEEQKNKLATVAAVPDNDIDEVEVEVDGLQDDGIHFEQGTSNSTNTTTQIEMKKARREYQILTPSDLQNEMEALSAECASVLALTCAQCKILLCKFKWNKMVLLERCYEAQDTEEFLRRHGIQQQQPQAAGNRSSNGTRGKKGLCQICISKAQLMGLSTCAHLFCSDCWAEYIKQSMIFENRLVILCPADKCDMVVDLDFARSIIAKDGEGAIANFERIQLNSFVQGNNLIKWCPGPNCERAVKVQLAEPLMVKCHCSHSWCFSCLQNWHAPAGCSLLKAWLLLCVGEAETMNWLNAYTKDCPKCKTAIEKNGGCNHMTCRSVNCRYEFCWVCMEDWKSHAGNYSCNRFSDKTDEQKKKAEDSRASLKRYIHYFDRFHNHENSLKLEHKLYEQVRIKTQQYQTAKFSFAETRFLTIAVDILCESRRTLMYTYAFAFYLDQKSQHTRIFEDNQQDLEIATEQLSEYLERDIAAVNDLVDLKIKVQDITRYVDSRRLKVLQHCIEGNEKNQWSYNHSEICPAEATVLRIY